MCVDTSCFQYQGVWDCLSQDSAEKRDTGRDSKPIIPERDVGGKKGLIKTSLVYTGGDLGFYGCDKDHDQKQFGEEMVYLVYTLLSQATEGSQGRNCAH